MGLKLFPNSLVLFFISTKFASFGIFVAHNPVMTIFTAITSEFWVIYDFEIVIELAP